MHSDLQTVVQQQSIETPMIEMGDPSTSQGCVQQTPVHHPGKSFLIFILPKKRTFQLGYVLKCQMAAILEM